MSDSDSNSSNGRTRRNTRTEVRANTLVVRGKRVRLEVTLEEGLNEASDLGMLLGFELFFIIVLNLGVQ